MTKRRQSAANAARSAGLRRYWRQVHAVQRRTGDTSARARRIVVTLRARGIATAYATRQHPRIVARLSRQIAALPTVPPTPARPARRPRTAQDEPETTTPSYPADREPPAAYADLDDWIDAWESYEGDDYEDIDVETNADY